MDAAPASAKYACLTRPQPAPDTVDVEFLAKFKDSPDDLAFDIAESIVDLIHENRRYARIFFSNYRDFRDKSLIGKLRALAGFMRANGYSLHDLARYFLSLNSTREWESRGWVEMVVQLRLAWDYREDHLDWFRVKTPPLSEYEFEAWCDAVGDGREAEDPNDPPGTAPSPRPPSRSKSLGSFFDERVTLTYIVGKFLPSDTFTTITGQTGSGKTQVLTSICLAVTTGRHDILGLPVTKGRVAYCAFENANDVRMRLMVAAHVWGIDPDELGDRVIIFDEKISPEDLVDELRELSTAGAFSLVIVDTLAAAFDGTDINSSVQTRGFIHRLREATRLPGRPAVLVAAHPAKSPDSAYLVPYGSVAIISEVDANLSLTKHRDGNGTTLHHSGKIRGLDFEPVNFRFEIHDSPHLLDNSGERVQIPVLRPFAGSIDVAKPQRGEPVVATDRDTAVLRAINENPTASIRELASSIGMSKSAIDRGIKSLKADKLLDLKLDGQLKITEKGRRAIESGGHNGRS